MFSSGGSPPVLSVLKGNLILVAGRFILQTEMDLCRSVPGSFSVEFVSSLRILLYSVLSVSPSNLAKVPAALFSLLQSLISLFTPESVKACLVDNITESGMFVLQSALPDEVVQL